MLQLQRDLNKFFGAGKRPRQPDYDRAPRAAFKRLAREHGFVWEKSRDGYLDIKACEAFPKGFSTAHYDLSETLERVQACLADPSLLDEDGGFSE